VSSDKGTVHVFSLDRRRAGGGAAGAAAAADAAAGAGGGGAGGGGGGGAAPADASALRNPVSAFSFVSVRCPAAHAFAVARPLNTCIYVASLWCCCACLPARTSLCSISTRYCAPPWWV